MKITGKELIRKLKEDPGTIEAFLVGCGPDTVFEFDDPTDIAESSDKKYIGIPILIPTSMQFKFQFANTTDYTANSNTPSITKVKK